LKDIAMDRAAKLQFERAVNEFVQWRAVPDDERSPAPAWWWGPAFEIRGVQPMPTEWCSSLQLPDGSSCAAGAKVFLDSLAGQTSLPWPGDFPRPPRPSNPS
jgi:hypothetical protein